MVAESLYFDASLCMYEFGVVQKDRSPTVHDLRISCKWSARCGFDTRVSNSVEVPAAVVDELRRC